MLVVGLIAEGKVPADNRVALTPAQCKWINKNVPGVTIIVEASPTRCFSDNEYTRAGIAVKNDVSEAHILMGIKEVPVDKLVAGKTYLFFSHTKKKQPYNQLLLQTIVAKNITLIDYECLEHDDGHRIIGFGFFAGVVGAHNGMMAYGLRTGKYELGRIGGKALHTLVHDYFGLKLPPIKIAVTGSGRVAHGLLEVLNLMEVVEVEPEEFLARKFNYPVFVQLKGSDLYKHAQTGTYNRTHFHENAPEYNCLFKPYAQVADILMNGIYWEQGMPRLFEMEDLKQPNFNIQTIADVTDDAHGSIPCNMGDGTIEIPVYGVDKTSFEITPPFLQNSIDIMAVGNLPNELPRDASKYFGQQLIKHVLNDLFHGGSAVITRATIVKNGTLTPAFDYLKEYAEGK